MNSLVEKVYALESNALNELKVPVPIEGKNPQALDLKDAVSVLETSEQTLLNVIALLAFLYFLYGAFSYIIAYGNEAKSGKAKQTMTWAVVGIVVAMLARFLVNFIKGDFKVN